MADKKKKRQLVSRNGGGLDDLDEGEIERIGGQDEDDEEESIEGHLDNSPSSSPERWDVLGLGQAMVSLFPA